MCGGEGCVDMARFGRSKLEFLLKFMKLEHGIPSHDAFSDLFNALDPGGLHDALLKLASGWGELLKDDVIAVDGKALRRSFKDAASRSPLHLVHAFAAQSRLVVGQVRVDAKSNRDHGDAEASRATRRGGTDHHGRRDAYAALHGRGSHAPPRRLRSGAEGQPGEAARRGPLPFRGPRQRGKDAVLQGLGQGPRTHRVARGNGLPRCPGTSGSTPLAGAGGRREGRGDARDQGESGKRRPASSFSARR